MCERSKLSGHEAVSWKRAFSRAVFFLLGLVPASTPRDHHGQRRRADGDWWVIVVSGVAHVHGMHAARVLNAAARANT